MDVQLLPVQLRATATDADGLPLPGAKIYTYETGTTTPLTVYQNAALSTPHANPIIAGSDGTYGPIYTTGVENVKIVITDALDATVDTIDPVPFGFTGDGWGNLYFSNFGGTWRLFQDDSNAPGVSNTTIGIALSSTGIGYFSSSASASNFNRNGDGAVQSIRRNGTQVGSISVSTGATAYNTSSDERLKENITDTPDPGDVIDQLAVCAYDWKAGGHVRFGMIAQQAADVFPEMVTHDAEADEWGVDYSKLVPVLLKEIQYLRERVYMLEARE
jgi:hypothetical protein